MKYLIALAGILASTTAFAEPVAGPMSAEGELDAGEASQVKLTILGGEKTAVLIAADEDDAVIKCGVFHTDGTPVVDDDNGDDRCGFVLEPKATSEVIVAVQNDGDSKITVRLLAR